MYGACISGGTNLAENITCRLTNDSMSDKS